MGYKPYKIPNIKKWLLTNEFLKTFKEELDRIFQIYETESNPNYWNTYWHLDGTLGFCEALKNTCIKYNVKKAIYEYNCKLSVDDSDYFEHELMILLCERNIIEKGSINDYDNYLNNKDEIECFEEIIRYKDYYVIKKDWKFKD